ncbi:MAG: hypothetical protein QXG99_01955 [Conexivisphaerales archaeon]
MVSGMDVSYKTVERLYSDGMIMMVLHNLLMLRRKEMGSPCPTPPAIGQATS